MFKLWPDKTGPGGLGIVHKLTILQKQDIIMQELM